jgi:hypothetical protein
MSEKNGTYENAEKQSNRIMEVQPWQYSTGPQTVIGKNRSKMNAVTHGFDTEILREIRKSERRPEVIELETLCKELIKLVKTGDPEKTETLADQLESKFQELSVDYDNGKISPEMQMEEQYTTVLMLKTVTFAIHKGAMKLCATIFER